MLERERKYVCYLLGITVPHHTRAGDRGGRDRGREGGRVKTITNAHTSIKVAGWKREGGGVGGV